MRRTMIILYSMFLDMSKSRITHGISKISFGTWLFQWHLIQWMISCLELKKAYGSLFKLWNTSNWCVWMAALGNPENLESEDPNQIPRRKRLHRRGKWGRGSRTSYCKCSHALSYSLGIEIRSVVVESFGSTIHLSSLKCETCIFHISGRTSISNACVNSRRASVDQSVSSGSNVACATSATGNAGNKEVVFQSPFLGLKDVMCKQVKGRST